VVERSGYLLSIYDDEDQKVRLLRSGADGYMISRSALANWLRAARPLLRRYQNGVDKAPVVRTGPLTVDLVLRTVTPDGRPHR
jgi:DNA-binding response OmpR family regulator